MIEIRSPHSRLAISFRALGLLALGGAALGLAIGTIGIRGTLDPFFTANQIGPPARRFMLLVIFGSGVAAAAGGAWFLARGRDSVEAAAHLYDIARRLSPLYLMFFPILLFRRRIWVGKDLALLTMVALFVLGGFAAATAAARAPAFRWEARLVATLRRFAVNLDRRGWLRAHLPFGVVLAGLLLYVVVVSRAALVLHVAVASSPELAMADNLMWNLLHGGSLFKFLPRPGTLTFPVTSHAELIAYVLVPIYALYQHPGTLLVLQSVLLGAAALPLFVLARAHVSPVVASAIALVYLLYPALHAENLSGFHFLALGPMFFWSAWALLDRGRGRWVGVPTVLATALAILLTLAVREDTALWIFVLGAYFIVSGRRPVAGLMVGAAGIVWFAVINFAVLRRLGGGTESLLAPYGGFVPYGKHGMGSVLATVLGNPVLIATTLADMPRLIYLLQMILPLAFLPLRRPLWLLLFIPGFVLTLLPVEMVAIRSLASPYGAHWIAFLFPGVALGIEGLQRRGAPGTKPHIVALVGLLCATIPFAYQFSPLMEEKPAAAGARPHAVRIDEDRRRRHDDCHAWRASTTRVKG